MLVTVCEYEQNPSRSVGGVAHTRFQDVRTDEWTDVPTMHSVSYFAGTDAFMSLHKPIITLFLPTQKNFYEFTISFHAIYKPISSKCWLGRTYGEVQI